MVIVTGLSEADEHIQIQVLEVSSPVLYSSLQLLNGSSASAHQANIYSHYYPFSTKSLSSDRP